MALQLRRFLGAGRSGDQVTTLHPSERSASKPRFWSGESRCRQLQRLRHEQLFAEHLLMNKQQSSRSSQSEVASVSTRESLSSMMDGHSQLGSPRTAMQAESLGHVHDLQQVQSQVANEVQALATRISKLGDCVEGGHTECSQLLQECTYHFEECAKKLRAMNKRMDSVGTNSMNGDSKLSLEACRCAPLPSQEEVHATLNGHARKGLLQQEASPRRSCTSPSSHAKKVCAKAANHRGRAAAESTPKVDQTWASLPTFSGQPMESIQQHEGVTSSCSKGEDQHFYVQTVNLPFYGDAPSILAQQATSLPHLPAYEGDDREVLSAS